MFAFLNTHKDYSEISFRTQDGMLLSTFGKMFESSWAGLEDWKADEMPAIAQG